MAAIDTSAVISLSERTQIMQGELLKLGMQPNTLLSPDDLFEFLDRRVAGRTFDRDIANQLYERMQKDAYGNITAGEFIKVYLEAEDIMRSRLHQIDTSINEYEKQKVDVLQKLDVIKNEEVLNAYGVMQSSKLTVAIYEFQYITTPIPNYMFVTVGCEQQALRSQVVEYNTRAVWNEEFEIDITTGLDDLQITVAGFNTQPETAQVLGEVKISLNKLKDQQIHEEFFDLFDRNGHLVGGKIHLGLQWIFSRVKYLNDVARKWDDHIRMHWDDKRSCENDLKILYDLFPALLNSYPKVDKKTSKPITPFGTHLKGSVSPTKPKLDPAAEQLLAAQEIELEWHEMGFWGHLSIYTSIALFILSLFACFLKADFADLVLSLSFLVHCEAKGRFKSSPERLYHLFLATIATIVYDLVWLIVYGHSWGTVLRAAEVTPNVLKFVIVIKWFSIVIKGLMAFVYHRFNPVLRASEGRVANIQLHHVRFSTNQLKNY